MIWNNDFLISPPSVFDGILALEDLELLDVLFQEEVLQEVKTSNTNLIQYLIKPEIMTQLIDNITQLTEKDCSHKLLWSQVHVAYISCEILTVGSSEIFDALLASPNSLQKIISCLVREQKHERPSKESKKKIEESSTPQDVIDKNEPLAKPETNTTQKEPEKNDEDQYTAKTEKLMQNGCRTPTKEVDTSDTSPIHDDITNNLDDSNQPPERDNEHDDSNQKPVSVDDIKIVPQKATLISKLISNIHSQAPADLSCFITKNIEIFSDLIQVLVNNIDVSGSFEILSTFINPTKPPELRHVFCEILSKLNFVFSLMNVMTLSNVEDKQRNACQLLCDIIVIGRREATENNSIGPSAQDMLVESIVSREAVHLMLKQIFSRKPNKDVTQEGEKEMKEEKKPSERTSSESDDNQKADPDMNHHGETLTSTGAPAPATLDEETEPNRTAIICGMKVLQILVEQKVNNSHANVDQELNNQKLVYRTIDLIQDEIAENLIHFHELLMNPPKQEPIKTTFGVIQKPLGFIRLEVVNLIRALLGSFSPVIIKKLVELKTMKIIIDLFVDYSWNNLLHTQVEQAVTYIIKNCRMDEDLKYQIDMEKHTTNHITDESTNQLTLEQNQEQEERLKQQQQQNEQEQQASDNESQQQQHYHSHLKLNGTSNGKELDTSGPGVVQAFDNNKQDGEVANQTSGPSTTEIPVAVGTDDNSHGASSIQPSVAFLNGLTTSERDNLSSALNYYLPSLALLSQLLNECDLIGKLLTPRESGKQANFGHIIQMINSVAISCDLDTIRDHLNEMKEKRPDLYTRWTTFVNVDVASFKEITLYYDVQSVNNHTNNGYDYLQKRNQSLSNDQHGYYVNSLQNHHQTRPHLNQLSNSNEKEVKSMNGNDDANSTPYYAFYDFIEETVIPSINVDVLPKSRGSTTNKNSFNY